MAGECNPQLILCDEVKRLALELEVERKINLKRDVVADRHELDINQLKTNQAETRVYVEQILNAVEKLENKIFTYVGQLTAANSSNNSEERTQKGKDTDKWIGLIKWILGGTIFLIIGYLFGGGKILK